MVSTRAKSAPAVPADPNRIVAVVTGANSGFGLGICNALLSNLSVPSGASIPVATAQVSALSPSLASAFDAGAATTASHMPSPHPTLTLVLACRSEANAQAARAQILAQHTRDLAARRRSGAPVPEGWEAGLRVEYELVDLDAMGGTRGVLAFTQRMRTRYPHITSLFLNAGYAAINEVNIPRFMWQVLSEGPLMALHHPRYNIEDVGLMSADGERGRVWGVNVLAPYVLAKELQPLLAASPGSLPFAARVVYTSSIEAEAAGLSARPLDDPELLTYAHSYRASKYMGDLVMTQLDRELAQQGIRCVVAEPGCVSTNIAVSGLGAWQWLVKIKWACYWLSFWLANLFGSPHHPVWAEYGAAPMLYAALVAGVYLLPATKVPGPKVHVVAKRWKAPGVGYGEVDEWERNEDVARGEATYCEQVRQQWRRKEGI